MTYLSYLLPLRHQQPSSMQAFPATRNLAITNRSRISCSKWPSKVTGNVSVRYSAYEFPLPFHSNHCPILYRFPHIGSGYISQIWKLEWLGYQLLKKVWYVKVFRYNIRVWQRDGQNFYTNIARQHCCVDLRGKNHGIIFSVSTPPRALKPSLWRD